MKNPHLNAAAAIVAVLLLAIGWSLVVWMAVIVSDNLLHTLQYIVDLAQMDP